MSVVNAEPDSCVTSQVDSLEVISLHATNPLERSVLRLLAIAQLHQRNAAELLRPLALDQHGIRRVQLEKFASEIENGTPLSEAVRSLSNVFSEETTLAIQVASDPKSLIRTYRSLVSGDELAGEDCAANKSGVSLFRLAGRGLVYVMIASFIFIFIVPTFEVMFDEFGLRLPKPTVLVISFANWFANYWFLLVPPLSIVAIPLLFSRLRELLNRIFGRGASVLGWRKTLTADKVRALTVLSVACDGGELDRAIGTLAIEHSGSNLRHLFQKSHQLLASGVNVWDALAGGGLLSRREAKALKSASGHKTHAWLLHWIAARRHERQGFWRSLVHRSITVVCLVVFGVFVAFTCISLFMPLVSLISGLS